MNTTILIVDDSAVLRASVRYSLENAGYTVLAAVNGQDGLEVLDRAVADGHRPALILTDINMPIMDGITFIKELKKGAHRFTPVLVLTTESEHEMKMKGKNAGAAGWIVKPFNEAQLLAVLRKFVRTSFNNSSGDSAN